MDGYLMPIKKGLSIGMGTVVRMHSLINSDSLNK